MSGYLREDVLVCVRSLVLGVVLSLVMLATTGLAASVSRGGQVQQMLRQVVPQVGQQLRNLTGEGKVLFKTVCVAAVCAIAFTVPASANLLDLNFSSELLSTRRARSSIGTGSSLVEKSGGHGRGNMGAERFSSNWWLSKGYFYKHSKHHGAYRVGFSGAGANYEVYLDNRLYYTDTPTAINDMGINVNTRLGGSVVLIPNGEGAVSIGYGSANLVVGTNTKVHQLRNYLLHYKMGALQVAALGHEYRDVDHHDAGSKGHDEPMTMADGGHGQGDLQHVRWHNLALYRTGVNADLPIATQELAASVSLNSVLGTNYGVGRIWQAQLEEFAGGHDLEHILYHRVGAGLELDIADGVLLLVAGADYAHTIEGSIQREGDDGDYRIGILNLSVGGELALLSDYGLSIEGEYIFTRQDVDAALTGKDDLDLHSGRHEVAITLVKSFE